MLLKIAFRRRVDVANVVENLTKDQIHPQNTPAIVFKLRFLVTNTKPYPAYTTPVGNRIEDMKHTNQVLVLELRKQKKGKRTVRFIGRGGWRLV